MEAISCEHCHRVQPGDWRPGDLCVHCGALARTESRCPWCTELGPGRFCRRCGCQLVAPSDYGVARMLFAAGVDRLSLGERLRALDPEQHALFASQFAAQLAGVAARVDEARACEAHLATKGWAAKLEEALVRALPVAPDSPWLKPGTGVPPPPGELFQSTALFELKDLAALALLRRGELHPEALSHARGLAGTGQPLALEAVLAISGWRARDASREEPWRRRDEVRRALLEEALAQPSLAAEAAVCLALELVSGPWGRRAANDERLAPFLAKVREALDDPNPDVRFGAAVVLADEDRLERAAANDADPPMREKALRTLAQVQGSLVAGRLVGGTSEDRDRLLGALSPPFSEAILAALLQLVAVADAPVRRRALGLVQGERFLTLLPERRAQLAAWLSTHAHRLGVEEALHLLDWASTQVDGARAEPAALRPFADAVTRALCEAPAPNAEWLRGSTFLPWLWLASTPADLEVLDRLVASSETCRPLFDALLYLHAREGDDQPRSVQGRALELLLGIWDRAGASRAAWIPTLARELASHRGIRGADALVAAFWQRFRDHEGERAQIVEALEAFKRELFELRDAEPKETRLDGGDPLRFFELYSRAVPGDLRELFEQAVELGGPSSLLPLARAAAPKILAAEDARPRTALLALARMAQLVCNAFREEQTEATRAAVEVLRESWRAFEPRLAQAHPATEWEADHGSLVRHVLDELEIIDRDEAERAERERERAAREAERARRAAEAQAQRERAEQEAQAAQEREAAARKHQEEALARRLSEARTLAFGVTAVGTAGAAVPGAPTANAGAATAEVDAASTSAGAVADRAQEIAVADRASTTHEAGIAGRLEPDVSLLPVDDEAIGPPPLPTLREYVRFMKQLSAGGDVLALFSVHGLDPLRWSECVNGWGRAFQTRQDAALRFGALMQASWTPTSPRCE